MWKGCGWALDQPVRLPHRADNISPCIEKSNMFPNFGDNIIIRSIGNLWIMNNTNSLYFKSVLLMICLIWLSAVACEDGIKKDPFFSCNTNEFSFSENGGKEILNFTTNTSWRANVSESWCSLSVSSAQVDKESAYSVVVLCQENTSYSERSCSITFTAGTTTHVVNVKQSTNQGLFIEGEDAYELSESEHILDIKVQTNVEYSVSIDSGCSDWISFIGTKGLTSSTVQIKVAANSSYDAREGKFTISQKGGGTSKSFSVKQGKSLGLFVSKETFELSKDEQVVEVEISANVDYEIVLGDDSKKWIKPVDSKALAKSSKVFLVGENTSYDTRTGSMTIKQKGGSLAATVTIIQSPTYGLILKQNEFSVGANGGTIEIVAESNLPIDVSIPEEVTWLTKIATKGLEDHSVTLEVSHNMYSTKERKAQIDVLAIGSTLKQTVIVEQKGQEVGTYYVPTYGALSYILENYDTDTITVMKITGYMNSNDFSTLRSIPNLTHLDFSEVDCQGREIPYGALNGMYQLKSVKIPSNILYIRDNAFYGCGGLECDIYIPENLIEIGRWAFMYCNKLTGELILPQTLTSIGYCAFSGCKSLTGDLILPDGMTRIEKGTFNECRGFNGKFHLPKNLKEIDGTPGEVSAFDNCSNIVGPLELPEGLEIIGAGAFYGMYHLQGELKIPDSVKEIGQSAFSGCSSLKGNPVFLESWDEIPGGIYDFCSGLTGEVIIPDGITSIGANAFRECSGLSGVVLPEGLISIGNSAFARCTGLRGSVKFPDSVTSINDSAFDGCNGLSSISFGNGLSYIGRYAFSYCKGISGILSIPLSVQLIDVGAFDMCTGLSHIAVYWETPIEYTDRMLPTSIAVEVPSKTGEKYKAANGWKNHPIVER